MATTLSPSTTYETTYSTPHYKKILPALNGVLVPADTKGATTSTAYFASVLGGSGRVDFNFKDGSLIDTDVTIKDKAYVSNNSSGGITFLAFNRASTIENVNVNVGANESGNTDFGDSIFFDTEKSNPVLVKNSTFITGNGTSPLTNDKDLLVFGSNKFDNTTTKNSFLGITGLVISASTEIDVTGSTVEMGNDRDSLIFASTNTNSFIQNSTLKLGNGADYCYFNRTQSILGGNTISLSDTKGGDSSNDSIIFASNQLTGVNGTTTKLTIANFEDGKDSLRILGGSTYTTRAAITNVFGSKIAFT
jgi:hypothetical protein